jgi:hypothetical protein
VPSVFAWHPETAGEVPVVELVAAVSYDAQAHDSSDHALQSGNSGRHFNGASHSKVVFLFKFARVANRAGRQKSYSGSTHRSLYLRALATNAHFRPMGSHVAYCAVFWTPARRTLPRPVAAASKKRQGTKSREVWHWRCCGRYGDLMAAPGWRVDVTPTGCGRRISRLARLEAYSRHLSKRLKRIKERTARRPR